ncbi:MAG: ABC transporter ATP-binding protein [Bryobacterales bacterium]|nr:ABC transporter ATP-binding protein/permease [Bryobacteraceae bacterium]MDW8354043.1 ABC transporter ATP-binding protein [Bryobacterales bacterium]
MKEHLRTLWPYLWRYRRGLLVGLAALVLKDLAAAVQPWLIGRGVDAITAGFRWELVLGFAGALIGLSAVKGVFQYFMRVIIIGISRDIEYDLRNDLFASLVRLSPDYYRRMRTGDLMARATNDLNAVRMMLGPGIMYWTETSLTTLFVISVMLWVDWPLTLAALLPAPLVSLSVSYFGRRIHRRFEHIQKIFSDITSRVQENIAGVRVIRAYVQEESELRRFELLNRSYIKENLRLARLSGLFTPLLQTLVGVMLLIVLWVGGARLLEGRISLGHFVMFNTYMAMLVWPMIAFGWVVNLMQRGTASLARINEILQEQPTIAAPAVPRRVPTPLRGEIRFDSVTVRYDGRVALEGVTLTIPAGATVAVVGHTGSGKSTLVQLIPRLLDPTAGAVLVDGVDVREFSPQELRRQIGFVPQETFLFSATLAENIAFGAPDASEADIRRAAEIAGLGPDVAGFPDGYRTLVGERGITLSGGQKQRTALARAILRNPRILILDDALSSVDTETEARILERLVHLMRERTTILISHRVSTVRHADRIFVIENGRLAEQGTHAELLALGGYYADLYQRQLLEEELEAI